MKIRNGFVSNSSSSSFVIIGYKISHSEIEEFIKKHAPEEYEKIVEKSFDEELGETCLDTLNDYMYDAIREDKVCPEGLSALSDGYTGDLYVGKVISDEKDEGFFNRTHNSSSLSGEEIMTTINIIKEKMGKKEPPSLMSGSRGC